MTSSTQQVSSIAAAMKFTTPLPEEKQGLQVTDTATDIGAKRIAVGFSDGSLSIYSGEKFLNCESNLQPHEQAVIRIAWIDGLKHGYCFASTGMDNRVCIYRDVANFPPASETANLKPAKWEKVFETQLPAVCPSIAWSPPQYGLIVAAACGDGSVSVFSAAADLNASWQQKTFHAHDRGCVSVTWAPCLAPNSLVHLPLVPPAQQQQQQQPSSSSNTVGKDPAQQQQQQNNSALALPHPRIATGGRGERTVKIWKYYSEDREWGLDQNLNDLPANTSCVRDINWAPNIGLPFTYLAASTDEGNIIVWRQDGVEGLWQHHLIDTSKHSRNNNPVSSIPVVRLHWSGVGSVLCSIWRDGQSAMWLEGQKGEWNIAQMQ